MTLVYKGKTAKEMEESDILELINEVINQQKKIKRLEREKANAKENLQQMALRKESSGLL